MNEEAYSRAYDKGFCDGQRVVAHSESWWTWVTFFAGIVLGWIVRRWL